MFPKKNRLTKEDFKKIRPKIFFRGVCIDIAYAHEPKQKYACVLSKKTLKRAVDRNKSKRRVMNILHKKSLPQEYSFVMYPKKTSISVPYSLLEEEINKAFDTLH